eukprot:CAMPEP_0203679712 /NCGR_PEP_ID=MMETSP0090-20130426/36666_1 /ASSEMBLY_ACC=CAM_ASM_001088 /TAXON_ID=426623 /ORGANISM="Chaetoceros affinis, Strain CCMP159" /LENGTH=1444 /DNA_ID=CAMNT_0050547455 /DNA_START=38 /DNA_END=4369 /DNA_ORIENTATION=-
MTKILSKAWSLDRADLFQEVNAATSALLKASSSSVAIESTVDLRSVGQHLDNGNTYPLGRRGWEKFAADIGFVYNQFILCGKKTKLAKQHLAEVCTFFAKIEPSLSDIAKNSTHVSFGSSSNSNAANNTSAEGSGTPTRKRKSTDDDDTETVGSSSKQIPKKRMTSDTIAGSESGITTGPNASPATTITMPHPPISISQREERAMNNLQKYIVDQCGGEAQQISSFRCRVTHRSISSSSTNSGGNGDTSTTQERYDTAYFNDSNRKFRSMIEVARFLNLVSQNTTSSSGGGGGSSVDGTGGNNNSNGGSTFIVKKGRPRNMRELESERKKLRKELDKLVKAHGKATKAMDDFHNDKGNDIKLIDDEILFSQMHGVDADKSATMTSKNELNENGNENNHNVEGRNGSKEMATRSSVDLMLQQSLWKVLKPEDYEFCFPGLPSSCTQDVLMVWDFLCTFSRALSLEPIDLDNFTAALNYKKPQAEKKKKKTSSSMLTSTAENDNTNDGDYVDNDEEEEFDENKNIDNDPLTLASKSSPPVCLAEAHLALIRLLLRDVSSDKWWWSTLETPETELLETENTTGRGEADNIAPTIKVDMVALLDCAEEDVEVTKRWLQALEDVRERRTNSGGAIKSAVKTASSITTNPLVKTYLRKSLQHWQGNAASFTKHSVMWLIGRVREARPDLWGRNIDPEVLAEQKAKVAREATASMAQLEDAPELESVDDNLHDVDSDEDDSDSDDDDNNLDEDTNHHFDQKKKKEGGGPDETNEDDGMAPVTSTVPVTPAPTFVDLLLPPSKPIYNSVLVSPFTWPYLAGASVCRILHRFKRLRNEVDDSLREFRDLRPLMKKERRDREKRVASRVFSECVALSNENGSESPIEEAAKFLTSGGDYLELNPLQRLGILRILIEAAYDTYHVHQCVQENITARKNAVTQLEKEERNARKEAKEAATALEQAARQRLVEDAINEFLRKKRRELARTNKQTNEFTKEVIESLTIEEIIDMDEDNKAEYEALPSTHHFSKAEVRAMVTQITEETAFNTSELEVLTLEEIESREGDVISSSRRDAIDALKDAIEDGTIKALRSAIRIAKNELLCGTSEGSSGMWTLDLLRDASLELKQAEKRKRVTDAQKDLIAKRNKCFVRTEELGSDRAHNKFWKFGQDIDGRIWLEADLILPSVRNSENQSEDSIPILYSDSQSAKIGALDEEHDFCPEEDENFLHFSRQEYHSSGLLPTLAKRFNCCLSSSHSLRAVLKYLNGRGLREGALKSSLKEIVEASGLSTPDSSEVNDSNEDEKEKPENDMAPNEKETEIESALFSYRNKMGRFCGRAADAPYASSPLFLGKLILKREQDCYTPLKSRTYENNWGGKSGARNAWIASIKEYTNDLGALRDGLLTLEDALFEMCGGFHEESGDSKTIDLSGKELLEKKETRFEIELESSVQKINGLW